MYTFSFCHGRNNVVCMRFYPIHIVPEMENLVASSDTPDELTMFNDLEKETLKLDRSILQQSETMESK
jgi:hypothetical protein